jgi:hypothetical protein
MVIDPMSSKASRQKSVISTQFSVASAERAWFVRASGPAMLPSAPENGPPDLRSRAAQGAKVGGFATLI